MASTVYDKTDKGREEIATRKFRLAPRLRTLLVLIDGRQEEAELLAKVAGIGLGQESLTELLAEGFVEPVSSASAATGMESAATAVQDPVLPDAQNQYQALYQFYTETIRSTIGLRGYSLQLKVEKATSVDDFRALRQPYLDAVLRAKGNEMERSLRARLDQLLAPANTA